MKAVRLTIADLEEVVAIYDDLARFFTLLTGSRTVPREYVAAELTEGPQGHEKIFLGLYEDHVLVGVADLLPAYPAPGRAWLGVLLIAERHQRRGRGRQGLAVVEDYARTRGAREMALGVELVNTDGRAFWIACGYRPTGELFDTDVLGHSLRGEVLKKTI